MAIVLSGLLLGILYARVVAGVIAEYVSWRNVYYMAIGTQGLVGISLYFALPDYPPKNPDLKYWQVFPTMIKFICTNPVLGKPSASSGHDIAKPPRLQFKAALLAVLAVPTSFLSGSPLPSFSRRIHTTTQR